MVDFPRRHFWAKSNGMRSGNRSLVTKPAGAVAGALEIIAAC